MAIPYDILIVGYKNHVVDTLRIWDAGLLMTSNCLPLIKKNMTRQ